jgi:adenosylhomocysteine nucleosidase
MDYIKNIIVFVALPSEFQTDHPDVTVIYTGVGKVNAAIMATKTLPLYNPENTIVYNYGSAGSKTLDKNKLYKCTKFEQHDMDARPLVDNAGITPYDENIYPNLSSIIEFFNDGFLCSTADRFQENPSASVVDMEAYSIAKVCKIFGFDFVSYKFISDDGNANDWEQNHMNGAKLFSEVLNAN